MRSRSRLIGIAAAAALLLAACGGDGDDGPASPAGPDGEGTAPVAADATVLATTTILGDLVEGVVEGCAEVEVLMPPGVDPHGFEPSAQQAAAMREADLVIANGLLLEEQLIPTLEAAEGDGVAVVYVAETLDPIPLEGEHSHGDEDGDGVEDDGHSHGDEDGDGVEDDGHSHGDEDGDGVDDGGELDDPHVWQDPQRMAIAPGLIADAVAEHTDCDPELLTANAEAVEAELLALDAEIEELLSVIPEDGRVLVTNHDAFGYFADRYGFEVIATIIPGGTTLAEPGSAELGRLAELVAEEDVPAIFAETTQSTELADALAREVGAEVAVVELFSDSLGEPGSDGETYVMMMRTNAERIAQALAS